MIIHLSQELIDLGLEPIVKRFFDAMVYKLTNNAHKGKWEGVDLERTLALLRAEVIEIAAAIKQGNVIEILLEAADVANFALIAASIAIDGETK